MTRRPEADNRIDARLAELRRQQRKAFATYLVADYLDADGTLAHMRLLARGGVDVIEVGYPFSDPILDGAVIQAMNRKAVAAGGTLARTIDLCAAFRADDHSTPLILMGYANPIATMGYGEFARRAAAAGVDGVIIGDMPLREAAPLAAELSATGLRFIPLAAPTLPAQEFVSGAPRRGRVPLLYSGHRADRRAVRDRTRDEDRRSNAAAPRRLFPSSSVSASSRRRRRRRPPAMATASPWPARCSSVCRRTVGNRV